MSSDEEPISAVDIGSLFAAFDRPLALAVSGGVDSMALMQLVFQWRQQGAGRDQPVPLVLTVDHGLRPAASDEARLVAAAAQRLGFSHETLTWTGAKPTSGIQDAARRARYDLLLNRLAADPQPRDLVLAHHLDDQAETLLMRLARGSGIDGLSAMRTLERRVVVLLEAPVREVSIRLRRPLLALPKRRLIATMQAAGGGWNDDPSNTDVRFERVRLRRSAAGLAELGLSPESLARSAMRLGRERAALIARTRSIVSNHVRDHAGAFGEFTLPAPSAFLPADIVRILARLIGVFGGAAPPAQLSRIETLADRVLARQPAATGRLTLGGCLIDIEAAGTNGRVVKVYREAGRSLLPSVQLAPGESTFWDRRFYISVAGEAQEGVRIGPFTGRAVDGCGAQLPRPSLAGLPAIVVNGATELLYGHSRPGVTCAWPMQHAAAVSWLDDGGERSETI